MMRVAVLLAAACCLAQAQEPAVAVLPFFNLTGSSNLDWIGESAAETIRQVLEGEALPVLDRENREEAYRRLSLRPSAQLALGSVIKLGRTLDAGRVIYGTFQVSPVPSEASSPDQSSLLLTAYILDLRNLRQEEPQAASGPLHDLGDVQNRLAWLTLKTLRPQGIWMSEEQFHRKYKPVRLDALENYIRGLLASTIEQKHRFLTQAVRLDETFTQPYFELGRLLYQSNNYSAAAGWLERVSPESPNAVEAVFLLGLCRFALAQYEGAETAFKTLSGLLPHPEVWNNLGAARSRLNRPEALEHFRRALEASPNDPVYLFNLGYALWKAGQYDEAAGVFRTLLDITPEDSQAILLLGRCLKQTPSGGLAMKMENFERIKTSLDRSSLARYRLGAPGGRP